MPRSRLSALRVSELRELATALGIGNIATMRKGVLVDAINERYDTTDTDIRDDEAQQPAEPEQQQAEEGTSLPDETGEQASSGVSSPAQDEPAPVGEGELADTAVAEQVQGEPEGSGVAVTASEDAVDEAEGGAEAPAAVDEQEQPAAETPQAETAVDEQPDAAQEEQPAAESAAPSPDEAAGGAEVADAAAAQNGTAQPKSAVDHVNAGLTGIAEDLEQLQRGETEQPEGERQGGRRGRGRGRNRAQTQGDEQGQQPQGQQRGRGNADAQPQQQEAKAEPAEPQQKPDQQAQQRDAGQQGQQDGEGRRGRYRDRKRRGPGGEWDEPEVRDDDVLIPIAGILDVLENYAFVRTSGYLSGPNDVYVSLGQVKKYHLRRGDAVVGSIRQVPEQEQPTRQKYNALVKVDSINGLPVAEAEGRVEFEKLTPLYPQERLRLETEPQKITTRVVDLVAPIGKGQRGLVIAPPRAGRTLLLQAVANAVTKNNPEAHLMVVLVDERPEEVTEMQRTVKGEVIASTFDRPAEDHTTVAELAIDRAKRLVELGYDVVVLLDSLTGLARGYAQTVPAAGRPLGGGLDAAALLPAKQFFGAARNIENGGSLTVLATALAETGVEADQVVLEQFRGAANMELALSSTLAEKRIFPAVDVTASGTVRDEQLLGPDEVKVTRQLRRALAGRETQEALETVVSKLRETGTNVEFLVQMQKSLPSGK